MSYRRPNTLTPRDLKAISFYVRGHSKRQAMLKAGFSEETATDQANRWFQRKDVRAEIRDRQGRLAVKSDTTLAGVLKYLKELLEVDPADLVDEEGNMLPAKDIPKDIAKLLNWKTVRGQVSLESVDKLRIVETIAKLTGLIQDTVTVRAEGELAQKIIAARKRVTALPAPVETDYEEVDADGDSED